MLQLYMSFLLSGNIVLEKNADIKIFRRPCFRPFTQIVQRVCSVAAILNGVLQFNINTSRWSTYSDRTTRLIKPLVFQQAPYGFL